MATPRKTAHLTPQEQGIHHTVHNQKPPSGMAPKTPPMPMPMQNQMPMKKPMKGC